MKVKTLHKRLSLLGLILLIIFCAGLSITVAAEARHHNRWRIRPITRTSQGWLRGIVCENGTVAWLGVPYARPPVDALRWKAPQNPDRWRGIRDADEFSAPCAPTGDQSFCSEDCLCLNIWRPQVENRQCPQRLLFRDGCGRFFGHALPVYFWIHGGGNRSGDGSDRRVDGANLATKTNMVVVSINYRLGPLGWLSHPALRHGENAADDSGNYGLLDIIAALEWVQENIRAFGGDPDNVTVAGNSAGATNIMSLLTSPLAPGLFHRAIMGSGLFNTDTVSEGDQNTANFICKLLINDDSAADQQAAEALLAGMNNSEIEDYLRTRSWQELLAVPSDRGVTYEDGTVVPEQARAQITNGDYYQVPVIIGSNKDEFSFFAISWYKTLVATYGQETGTMLYLKLVYYASRLWEIRGVDELATDMSQYQDDVYTYLFRWDEESSPYNLLLGAVHSINIAFLFGSFDMVEEPLQSMAFNDANQSGRMELSENMMAYWSKFAQTGSPEWGGADLPAWDPWEDDLPNCINLDAEISFSADELTYAGLMAQLATEDSTVQTFVMSYLSQLDFY